MYIIFTKKKATWTELQKELSVDDLFDLLEIIEVEGMIEKAQHHDAERESKGR